MEVARGFEGLQGPKGWLGTTASATAYAYVAHLRICIAPPPLQNTLPAPSGCSTQPSTVHTYTLLDSLWSALPIGSQSHHQTLLVSLTRTVR